MPLKIIGSKSSIDLYRKQRGIVDLEGIDWDPATGQQVVYDGLKRLGAQGVSPDMIANMKNNPYIKHGPDFRMGYGGFAAKAHATYAKSDDQGGLYLKRFEGDKLKALDLNRRLEVVGVANANIIDRYDERVNPAGLDAMNFNKNRVLLLDHNYSVQKTVGRVNELMPDSDGVKFAGFVGDPEVVGGWQNLVQAQQDVMSLIAQGLIQTVSIGFIAKKIRAPLYDDKGNMEEPAVIELWELLELSIVAVPANPGSVFQEKAMAKSFYKMLGQSRPKSYGVLTLGIDGMKDSKKSIDLSENEDLQTLILSREKFTLDQATSWIKDNGFKVNIVDEQPEEYRFLQREESDFEPETIRRLLVDTGIEANIGLLKEDNDSMTEEQAKALVDGIKALNETSKTVAAGISDLKGQNEKILGSIEGKGKKEDEEEENDSEKKIKTLEDTVTSQGETLKQIETILEGMAKKLAA